MAFPDRIQIPAVTAATLQFRGDLTARDQSILLIVAWYAAAHGLDEHSMVDVPDLDLRRALGGLKTMKTDREGGYYARLAEATLSTDERLPNMSKGVTAPIVTQGMRRMTVDGAYRWEVSQALVDAFQLREGEPLVEVPMSLLARARSRFSLTLLLRALSWQAGDVEPHWILRKRAKAVEYKLRLDDVRDMLGTDATGVDLDRYVLAPAVAEIDHLTDTAIEYEMIAKPGLGPKGRVRAVVIMVGVTERLVYRSARKPRTFGEMGKAVPKPSGRVIPLTRPFGGGGTRKVVPALPVEAAVDDDMPAFMR